MSISDLEKGGVKMDGSKIFREESILDSNEFVHSIGGSTGGNVIDLVKNSRHLTSDDVKRCTESMRCSFGVVNPNFIKVSSQI